jgi:hypothetical protein
MSTTILCLLTLLWAAFGNPAYAQNEDFTNDPGYVDFAKLTPVAQEKPTVRIHLKGAMLKMAAGFGHRHLPEASEAMDALKLIHVETYEARGDSREKWANAKESIDKELQKRNWDTVIQVDEEDESVSVSALLGADGKIKGLMVVSMKWADELTFVNIVGDLEPSQLNSLNHSLDLPVDIDLLPEPQRRNRREFRMVVPNFNGGISAEELDAITEKALRQTERIRERVEEHMGDLEIRLHPNADPNLEPPESPEPPE